MYLIVHLINNHLDNAYKMHFAKLAMLMCIHAIAKIYMKSKFRVTCERRERKCANVEENTRGACVTRLPYRLILHLSNL